MVSAMTPAVAFAWLATPFISGAVIARWKRARYAIGGHLVLSLSVGWLGVALMMWGATALATTAGLVAFVLGGPLAGLSFWVYDGPDDDCGGGGGGGPAD